MASAFNSIILVCWIIFLLYWVLNAWRVKATAEKQSRWSAMAHRIPLGFSYILLVNGYLPAPMNLSVTPHAAWAQAMGAIVCVVGLFVTLWARWTLAGNWSSDVTFKHGHELIRSGPYQFVRHPIYTGLLAMGLGTALDIGRLRGWLALPLMAVAFWIKLRREEGLLMRHFPEEYPAYRKQVKALILFAI
jgi:protein-S-isoprenylcysteine O-methyltransferase Ste14